MNKCYIHNPAPVLEIDTNKRSYTDGSPILRQETRPNNNQRKKKRIFKIVDFTVPVDHKIKLKESEKKDK